MKSNLRTLKNSVSYLCFVGEEGVSPAEGGGGSEAPASDPQLSSILYPEGGETDQGAVSPPEGEGSKETPPAAEAKPEGEAEGDKPEGEEGKPDAFADLKLPEGFEVDAAKLTSFKELSAKLGFNTEGAQELLNLYADQATALADSNKAAWEATMNDWRGKIEADKELGGEKMDGVVSTIGKALDEFGSDEAREAFEITGAGNNPAIVRFVYRMAAALSEGRSVPAGGPAPRGNQPTTLGGIFYGDSQQKG